MKISPSCHTQHFMKTKASKPANLVPQMYHQYLKVFSKKESDRMPIRKLWNHAIDLKEMFKPFHLKNRREYPISLMINYQRGTSGLLNQNKPS